MATTVDKHLTIVGMKTARTTLPEIVNDLREHPERVYSLMRYQEPAAVIMNRDTFDALIDALEAFDDARDSAHSLEAEPLDSFEQYHARRLARRTSNN